MTAYDNMPQRPHRFEIVTAGDGLPSLAAHPVTQQEYDELVARLAAYQPIIDGLRKVPESVVTDESGDCMVCDGSVGDHSIAVEYWTHARDCPWWLAQQLGGQT